MSEVMRAFVLYDRDTGEIAKSGMCGPLDWEAQKQDGLDILETGSIVTYPAFVKGDTVQPLPPSPGDWAVFDRDRETWLDPRDPAKVAGQLAADARAARDRRIADTDWTQLPDVPAATRDLWAPYRQALRDITDQAGFPASIDWPDPPA